MTQSQHKVLSKDKALNLLRQATNNNRNDEPGRWPGEENTIRLAKAVDSRSPYVVFRNGTRFSIKYNMDKENVLIKPSTGNFFPMGYFSFRQLKDAGNAVES